MLLLLIAHCAFAADDLKSAARELARKTVAFAGAGQLVSVAWRNLSSLGSAELADARDAFGPAFKAAGGIASDAAGAVEARITISENASQYLLVEEVRRGDERQVWLAPWNRAAASPALAPGAALEKRLVWEQDEQILDAAFPTGQMLLLTPSSLLWFSRQEGQWTRSMSVALPAPKSWPRDLRGRLRIVGLNYVAYLPGLACSGAWQPPVSVECKASGDPWVLESGSRDLLLANFAAGRNYFDGRIATQTGLRKTVEPFYSAASVEERGKTLWLLAMVDGRTRLFDEAFDPAGDAGAWGSDIAGTDARVRRRLAGPGHSTGRRRRAGRGPGLRHGEPYRRAAGRSGGIPRPRHGAVGFVPHLGSGGIEGSYRQANMRLIFFPWLAVYELGRRSRLPVLLLLAVTAPAATRPHYGGTLRVEIHESIGAPDAPQALRRWSSLAPGFTLASWDAGRRAVFAAEENAPGGRPFLDSVEIQMARPLRDQAMDLGLGKADVVELEPATPAAPRPAARCGLPRRCGCWRWCSRPRVADARIREALALAVDRTAIYNVLLQRQGEISGALLPQWLSGYAFLFPAAADLARARGAGGRSARAGAAHLAGGGGRGRSAHGGTHSVNARDAGLTVSWSRRARRRGRAPGGSAHGLFGPLRRLEGVGRRAGPTRTAARRYRRKRCMRPKARCSKAFA